MVDRPTNCEPLYRRLPSTEDTQPLWNSQNMDDHCRRGSCLGLVQSAALFRVQTGE